MASQNAALEHIDLIRDGLEAKKSRGSGPPPTRFEDDFDRGGNDANGEEQRPLGNAFIAMLLFLGADIMLFAGLVGAFMVFRYGAENWPPADQPRLPVDVTAVNTAILFLSGLVMARTWQRLPRRNRTLTLKSLLLVVALGATFLLVQGYEWLRLLDYGLKLTSGVFGATFYTLIGCHALHVLGALVWLVVVCFQLRSSSGTFDKRRIESVKLIGIYWFLVVALWPILYGLVYLS